MLIKFKLEKIENFGLKFQVLDQYDSIVNRSIDGRVLVSKVILGHKYTIQSYNQPQLKLDKIYLRGIRTESDNDITIINFASEMEREIYLTIFIDLFKELSNKYT